MKITMLLDQAAMNKSRKCIMFAGTDGKTGPTRYTLAQSKTVYMVLKENGIAVDNQTGLKF